MLTIGQLMPPPLLGTDEEKREQLANVSYVPIRVIGRYGPTRRRIEEVIAVLQENLERHDAMVKSLKEENG